jgi:hypothetical protein
MLTSAQGVRRGWIAPGVIVSAASILHISAKDKPRWPPTTPEFEPQAWGPLS